jgi:hypothetical protein
MRTQSRYGLGVFGELTEAAATDAELRARYAAALRLEDALVADVGAAGVTRMPTTGKGPNNFAYATTAGYWCVRARQPPNRCILLNPPSHTQEPLTQAAPPTPPRRPC